MVGLFVPGVETSLTCYKESELFITMEVSLGHHLLCCSEMLKSQVESQWNTCVSDKEHHEDVNSQN